MRTRTLLVFVPMFAAAAGFLAIGCGDDTTGGTTGGTEAGGPDTGGGGTDATKPDTSTGDAAKETGADAAKEAAACMDASINVATFDSGSATWACYQQNCAKDDAGNPGTLPQCAADCTCNSAIATALSCVQEGGVSQTTPCFTTGINNGGMYAQNWYLNCVMPFMGTCGGTDAGPGDGGDAETTDGGEASTDGGTDSGTDSGDGATE
jgi:hypothetical protein